MTEHHNYNNYSAYQESSSRKRLFFGTRCELFGMRAFCPEAPLSKLTFHTFRMSSIGYHAIDLGLSTFEVQAISRHKYGSSVTQDIYLAKSKQIIADLF